jgi:hypothetical protein
MFVWLLKNLFLDCTYLCYLAGHSVQIEWVNSLAVL